MRRLMPRRFSIGALLAVFVVGVGGSFYFYSDWAFDERDIVVATPSPFPRFDETTIRLAPRSQACIERVALGPRAEVAQFRVRRTTKRPEPLELVATGPGYRASFVSRQWPSNNAFGIPFDPPDRELLGEVCLRNLGSRTVRAIATAELRTASRSQTRVDGRRDEKRLSMHLYEGEPSSLASNMPQLLDRIAAFEPPYFGKGFLWALLGLTLVGIPLGLAAAFGWAVGRDRAGGDEP